MRPLRRLPKRRMVPIQIPQPLMNKRIPTPNISQVRLEMLNIHHIKPNNCREETDICFGDAGTEVERSFGRDRREMGFHAVEGGKEGCDSFLIGLLRGSKARFVDAIVDVVVSPIIVGFDIRLERGGEEVYFLVFFGQDVVKLPPQD